MQLTAHQAREQAENCVFEKIKEVSKDGGYRCSVSEDQLTDSLKQRLLKLGFEITPGKTVTEPCGTDIFGFPKKLTYTIRPCISWEKKCECK